MCHRFILHASRNNCLNRMAILPLNTRFRYFGIHTKCTCKRCFVCAPVQYPAMARLCQKIPPLRHFYWLRSRQPFIPELESSGFSGSFYKELRSCYLYIMNIVMITRKLHNSILCIYLQLTKETYISEGHLSGIAIQGDEDHTSVDTHFGMASLATIQRKGHMEMTDAAGISLEHVAHP